MMNYQLTFPDKLYQYDINQRIEISGITTPSEWQLHFARVGDATAQVIEVHESDSIFWGYIPNQLLELGGSLYCYLYNVTAQKAYTEAAIMIKVIDRPKPDDYVSDPTDVLTWGQLKADIGTLSELTTDNKSNLVSAINEVNGKADQSAQSITDIYAKLETKQPVGDYITKDVDDLTNYYTKTETDELLDEKQPVGDYVKSVNGSVPDAGGNVEIDVQTYTAGEGIDISGSGEIAVTNPMDDKQVSETTTWSSLNVIKQLSSPISETGSIITCYPVEGSPLHVVSDITAVQDGTGDPSPDNVRPIVGWSGANLTTCGKNFCDSEQIEIGGLSGTTGVEYAAANRARTPYIPISTGTYIVSGMTEYVSANAHLYNQNNEKTKTIIVYADASFVIADKSAKYFRMSFKTSDDSDITAEQLQSLQINFQLELGTTATAYEPYRGQTYTADFGETVYGGTLDWATGVLTVDSVLYQFTGNENINQSSNTTESAYCVFIADISPSPVVSQYADMSNSYFSHGSVSTVRTMSSEDNTFAYNTNSSPFIKVQKTKIPNWDEQADTTQKVALMTNYIKSQYQAGTPLTVCYTIEPYTIQLTPAQVLAIAGTNTVYCDTGDVTVSGYEDPRTTIANLSARIAALESAATEI